MASWPSTLQQCLESSGFGYSFGDTRLRSSTGVGPAKVRNTATKSVNPLKGTIFLDKDQYNTLYNFYFTTLVNGTLTFTLLHPITKEAIEVRFVNTPSFVHIGGTKFQVSLDLEEMP